MLKLFIRFLGQMNRRYWSIPPKIQQNEHLKGQVTLKCAAYTKDNNSVAASRNWCGVASEGSADILGYDEPAITPHDYDGNFSLKQRHYIVGRRVFALTASASD